MNLSVFLKKFTKLFPVPKSLSFDFIGVDICRDSVRVMKLKNTKKGFIPIKYGEFILKKQCSLLSENPELEDCSELLAVLKKIKKEFDVDYVNVSIPELKTYIYNTKVPSSVGANIQQTITFSLEENAPIEPRDALLDYYVLGIRNGEVEVVVTVVPKSIIESYTRVFEQAGLKPISFEPETHAIVRGIIKKKDKNQYLLLNLDNCLCSVAVIDNEVVQYTQTIPTSGNIKKDGFSEEDLKVLKESINKLIIYWSTLAERDGSEEIENMFIVGENAYSTELINFLEKNLPVNVKYANVWNNCFSLDDFVPEVNSKDSLKYATVIGLALKEIK